MSASNPPASPADPLPANGSGQPKYGYESDLHEALHRAGAHALVRLIDRNLAEMPKPRLKRGDRDVLKPLKRLDCGTCVAACCKVAGYVDLSLLDAQRLADFLGISIGTFLDTYTIRYDDERVIKLFGDRCRFLGADDRCTVYEARPQTCRDYLCWRGDAVTNNVARVLGAQVVERPRFPATATAAPALPPAESARRIRDDL